MRVCVCLRLNSGKETCHGEYSVDLCFHGQYTHKHTRKQKNLLVGDFEKETCHEDHSVELLCFQTETLYRMRFFHYAQHLPMVIHVKMFYV